MPQTSTVGREPPLEMSMKTKNRQLIEIVGVAAVVGESVVEAPVTSFGATAATVVLCPDVVLLKVMAAPVVTTIAAIPAKPVLS